MDWLTAVFTGHSVAGAVVTLSLVAAVGLALGQAKFLGVSLGVGGVLFSGLAFGHFHLTANPEVLEFVQEFGLILFVFSIGLQVGPGFLDSLRRQGLALNSMAAAIVLLGVALTIAVHLWGGVDAPTAVGLFSGATTNTPSLAACTQAIKDRNGARQTGLTGDDATAALEAGEDAARSAALGYAVAYPFGILGIILCMLFLRVIFRVDPQRELQQLAEEERANRPRLIARTIEVTNSNFDGRTISQIPGFKDMEVVISRVLVDGEIAVGKPSTALRTGVLLHAVGTPERLDDLQVILGRVSSADLKALPAPLSVKRILVTEKAVLGKTISELRLLERHGVTITRITRSGFEFSPGRQLTIHFGDLLLCVGEDEELAEAARVLGNSAESLNHPQVLPVFVGIVLGVLLGLVPVSLPGMPAPVKLGLAGGPLLAAILLSRVHSIGGLVWQLPTSANLMLREVGISLFLACVGLRSGDKFIATLTQGDGLRWMGLAALITFVPIFSVGVFARLYHRTNYASLCGLLAGSMTDPPALAFASATFKSDLPYVSYATVYPLVMILRLVCAQVIVLLFY